MCVYLPSSASIGSSSHHTTTTRSAYPNPPKKEILQPLGRSLSLTNQPTIIFKSEKTQRLGEGRGSHPTNTRFQENLPHFLPRLAFASAYAFSQILRLLSASLKLFPPLLSPKPLEESESEWVSRRGRNTTCAKPDLTDRTSQSDCRFFLAHRGVGSAAGSGMRSNGGYGENACWSVESLICMHTSPSLFLVRLLSAFAQPRLVTRCNIEMEPRRTEWKVDE